MYVYGYAALYLTYLFALALFGPRWLFAESSILNPKWVVQFAMLTLPAIIPFTMRLLARRRASAFATALCPCGSGSPFKTCCLTYSEALRDRERNFYKTFT